MAVRDEQLHELLYQALETERGGIAVYETALRCAIDEDLRKEWEEYLEQTRHHEQVVTGAVRRAGPRPLGRDSGSRRRTAYR